MPDGMMVTDAKAQWMRDVMGLDLGASQPEPSRPGGEQAGAAQAAPALPHDASASKSRLQRVVAAFAAAVRPSESASGIYDVTFKGRTTQIDQKQYDDAVQPIAAQIGSVLETARRRADTAMTLYAEKRRADEEYWLTSRIVHLFGRVRDPSRFLEQEAATARTMQDEARAALAGKDLVAAANAVAECEAAALKAHLLVQGYCEGSIDATGFQIKVLEGVEETCKVTLTALSIVATMGGSTAAVAAAGAIGSLGKTAMDTAGKIAGDQEVDWAELGVEVVIELVVARFGDVMEKQFEELVVKALLKELGGEITRELATKFFLEASKVVLKKYATATFNLLHGQVKPREEVLEDVKKDLMKSDSLFAELLKVALKLATH